MRKTKIIATIGPASMDYSMFKKMVEAGMNIVRINLSHAKLDGMERILSNVKRARKEYNLPLPIMVDTRGPEVRVKTFRDGSADIKKNQIFVFTADDVEGDSSTVSINLPSLVKSVKRGDKILAVNGLLEFKVLETNGKDIITRAVNSGTLGNRKSLFIPNVKLDTEYLNKADKTDILWAIKNNIDYVAASFVNSKADVVALKNFISKNGGKMKVISKIESQCGVNNMDEIIANSDGIMVARGDLGVEVAMEKLPQLQKEIIKKSNEMGKPVITATEMLESMINNPRPTRAEVSDVANAVFDGTSCVMLSGESASGSFPVEAVSTMSKICLQVEGSIDTNDLTSDIRLDSTTNIVSFSVVQASKSSKEIKAIASFTKTGLCASMLSRFKPSVDILGMTPDEKVYRQLDMLWGVRPILTPVYNSTDEMFEVARDMVKKYKLVKSREKIIITCGAPNKDGGTNLMRIDEID